MLLYPGKRPLHPLFRDFVKHFNTLGIILAAFDFTRISFILVRTVGDYGFLDIYICNRQGQVQLSSC